MRKYIITIPLLGGIVLLFSFSSGQRASMIRADHKIILVVDAAHGGADMGSQFGVYVEKDIDLKVARRMNALAPAHNIEVHLTRSADNDPALDDRVDFSNKLHPDYFISIHIGDDSVIARENFRVLVTKNAVFAGSWHLGAAVTGQLLKSLGADSNDVLMKTQGLHILRKHTSPAIMIDISDIKNTAAMRLLADEKNLDELCNAILDGVVTASKEK